MRLLKFFSLVAMLTMVATYVKADQMSEENTSNDLQQEISYRSNSNEPANAKAEESMPAYDQGYGLKDAQMMSAYNAPSRFDVKGSWDAFVTVSYIYWQPKEKGLEYALTIPADAAVLAPVDYSYKVHDFSYDYKSGFKLSLGTNLGHDNWLAMIEYIRLTGTQSGSAAQSTSVYTSTPERIFGMWLRSSLESSPNFFTKITGRWELKYNMLNLEFARPCYVGTKLTFKPHMGLAGGWIDQNYKSVGTILTNTNITADAKSDSWLIGPRAGVDTRWILGAGVSLDANLAGALVYQDFDNHFKQTSGTYTTNYTYIFDKDTSQTTPVLEGAIGMSWGTYLDNNNWHLSFDALYEFLVYFNQNYLRKSADQVLGNAAGLVRINSKAENLMLNGLTITARLDF